MKSQAPQPENPKILNLARPSSSLLTASLVTPQGSVLVSSADCCSPATIDSRPLDPARLLCASAAAARLLQIASLRPCSAAASDCSSSGPDSRLQICSDSASADCQVVLD